MSIGNIDAQDLDTTEFETTTGEVYTTESTTTTTLPPEIDREWEELILAGPTFVQLSQFILWYLHHVEIRF